MLQSRQKNDVVSDKVKQVISTICSHMRMDLAIISDFTDSHQVVQYVDGSSRLVVGLLGESTPLDDSYCYLVTQGRLPCVVPNSALDPTTKSLEITQRLEIASYISAPLRGADGRVYGMFLCIGHEVNADLNCRDVALMETFADMAGVEINERLMARKSYSETLSRIREVMMPNKLNVAYQPIFDLRECKIIGYESLARFNAEPYRTPDVWFEDALSVGLDKELELLAIRCGIEGMNHFDDSIYISLNVSPDTILSRVLEGALSDNISHRIVLEITEHSPVADYDAFREAMEPLRKKGVRLAVDDAGAGFASFQHILELNPEIIKLDISLIKGINNDPARRALASALIVFSRETDTIVVAEGVETREEYDELLRIGVDKVQGYYIGYPMPVEQAVNYKPPID